MSSAGALVYEFPPTQLPKPPLDLELVYDGTLIGLPCLLLRLAAAFVSTAITLTGLD